MKDCPVLEPFLQYLGVVRGRAPNTVDAYKRDLIMFLSFLKRTRAGEKSPSDEDVMAEDISAFSLSDVCATTRGEILSYLAWAVNERENSGASRKRKLAAIRMYFKYLVNIERAIKNSPAAEIDPPKLAKRLPKYLSEKESVALLAAALADEASASRERDFCMLTLFLNCGMRLSELVSLNLSDIDTDMKSLRVMGKGAKERVIYLNDACREALNWYFPKRDEKGQVKHEDRRALFLSRNNRRISNRMVQNVVYKYLDAAGLSHRKCSAHKLRHTAATLMYQSGAVDIRVLKDILGHEELSTTQIYTHVSDDKMEEAMIHNPLAHLTHKQLK